MALARSPSSETIARSGGPTPKVRQEDTRLVVSLRGEQDMSTASSLAAVLVGATAESDGDVVVDLSRVEFIDAAIVTVLVRSRNALRLQSRDLTLRAPQAHARRILDLCGLRVLIDPASAIDADYPDPDSYATVSGMWSRTPLRGRALQAIPPMGRPPRTPGPFSSMTRTP
jgi:anti-sigma B factor antagonist